MRPGSYRRVAIHSRDLPSRSLPLLRPCSLHRPFSTRGREADLPLSHCDSPLFFPLSSRVCVCVCVRALPERSARADDVQGRRRRLASCSSHAARATVIIRRDRRTRSKRALVCVGANRGYTACQRGRCSLVVREVLAGKRDYGAALQACAVN